MQAQIAQPIVIPDHIGVLEYTIPREQCPRQDFHVHGSFSAVIPSTMAETGPTRTARQLQAIDCSDWFFVGFCSSNLGCLAQRHCLDGRRQGFRRFLSLARVADSHFHISQFPFPQSSPTIVLILRCGLVRFCREPWQSRWRTIVLDPTSAFASFPTFSSCLLHFSTVWHQDDISWHQAEDNTFWVNLLDCMEQYCELPNPDLGGCSSPYV